MVQRVNLEQRRLCDTWQIVTHNRWNALSCRGFAQFTCRLAPWHNDSLDQCRFQVLCNVTASPAARILARPHNIHVRVRPKIMKLSNFRSYISGRVYLSLVRIWRFCVNSIVNFDVFECLVHQPSVATHVSWKKVWNRPYWQKPWFYCSIKRALNQ